MTTIFNRKGGSLYIESVAMEQLAAHYGTPLYVYSQSALTENYQSFDCSIQQKHRIFYAVKANANLSILKLLSQLGSGFDIVSGGELLAVLASGASGSQVIFSGVGKQKWELDLALEHNISCFNVESEAELQCLAARAQHMGKIAPIALRVNPDVDAQTHPYISTGLHTNKFGISIHDATRLYKQAQNTKGIVIRGVSCHIGSQILQLSPFADAIDRVMCLVDELRSMGIDLEHIDMGGGLGVRYEKETVPQIAEYGALLSKKIPDKYTLFLEPGRSIAANTGVLLTRVEYLKQNSGKHFAIVDAGMNDLIRPCLYQSYHHIENIRPASAPEQVYDVVGPICETGDFLAKDRSLCLEEEDILCIYSAGAYSRSLASNYNMRTIAAEVLVCGEKHRLIAPRQGHADLLKQQQAIL